MNDLQFDTRLVAATNRRSDDTNTFIKDTMQKIRVLHAADALTTAPRQTIWQKFAARPFAQRMALGTLAAIAISVITFTGYAYAIGSDPISLIKRWVEGDKIKIEYDGHTFEHGKARSYSDAAVTALAEANTVEGLAFRAKNDLQTPKDGVEYVDVPPSAQEPYEYPFFAAVTSVGSTVNLHKVYLWGDKMNPSHDLDETIATSAGTFRYFAKGEPKTVDNTVVGQLVMVFPGTGMRHTISTNEVRKETNYFSFALSHELASFKEVARKNAVEPGPNQPIFEPNWGGLSNICNNNGADSCDYARYSKPANQGLFVQGPVERWNSYNRDAIRFGEGVAMDGKQPENLIMRNLAGTINALDDTSITIKTSSGATWRLAYPKSNRDAFAKHFGKGLAAGDKLLGMITESIYNLNNRTISLPNIVSLERYQ
jgi:hypothetical protein